jgi:hypothetical protein
MGQTTSQFEYFQGAGAGATTASTTTPTINSTCPTQTVTADNVMSLYANGTTVKGIITTDVDAAGLTNVATFVNGRVGNSYLTARPQINEQTGNLATGSGTAEYVRNKLGELVDNDKDIAENLKAEYCWFSARYNDQLGKFLTAITSATAATNTETLLQNTIKLNRRLNAMLEVMDYLGKQRVQYVNDNASFIDEVGNQISTKLDTLQASANVINSEAGLLRTQEEMMRFTLEKNNHIRNQISLWASLNILALGTIFYVYRKI